MAVVQHSGKWRVEIYQKGKKIYRKGGFKNELEAKNHEAEIMENLEQINTTFFNICESRLDELLIKRSSQHYRENNSLIKNLIERWGRKTTITRDDVEKYLYEVAEKSKATANKRLRLIRALFGHAVKRGWIRQSPCLGIERFPETKVKRYIPSEEDIQKVIDLAKPLDRLYLLTVAHTLGRVRSVNNLKWEDVHDDFVSLYTRKSKNSDLKEIRVPMNEVLKQVLSAIPKTSEYVFLNNLTGKPYDYRDKFLPRLCRIAGVKPFMYHALRHYGASKLDNLGVALTDIRDLLGHERSTTTDRYLQSIRGSTKEAIKKLEGLK